MAMRIGDNADPEALTKNDWSRFAVDLGVGERYVRDTAKEVVAAVHEQLLPTLRAFEKELGRKDYLRSAVIPTIEKTSRRVAASLRA